MERAEKDSDGKNEEVEMADKLIKEGIINLNKPKGWTSHDCVKLVRSLSGVKRVGHTGTLDPMAEGVLPICIGSAARVMEYLDMDLKRYVCRVKLGITTDTLDIWGSEISDRKEVLPKLAGEGKLKREALEELLSEFSGKICQTPPKYSALKVNGRKLYEYARAGEDVEIKSRNVYVEKIRLLNLDLEKYELELDITCSKGTYIRSICADIGERLGCGAAMSKLVRMASGAFKIEESVTIEELSALRLGENQIDEATGRITKYARALPEELNRYIKDTDSILTGLGEIEMCGGAVERFCNGIKIPEAEAKRLKEPLYRDGGAPMDIALKLQGAYRTYGSIEGARHFLGVALYDAKHQVYKGDKIFFKKQVEGAK